MSNNATVITMNTTAMIPELTTLRERLQEVTSPSPSPTDDVFPAEEVTHPLMWIPYVVLGGVLILLAVASFVHYHVQNRGKYEEQKYKAKAGLESGPVNRKYRVTLNINGAPYTVGKIAIETLSAAETESGELPPEPPLANGKIPSYRSAINLPPIGEVGLVHNKKAAVRHEDSSDTLSSRERHHRTGHSSPEAQCSYVNEAFDSSGDSEKSLISREMLKRQRKMEKHRQQQQHSRQMETLSSDLEADERSGESNDALGDAAKTRRKPKQKYSSGNSQRSGMVMPVLPDRGSQQQQQQQQHNRHQHQQQQQQKPPGRPRKFSDPTSRVHPGIDSSRDSLQSDTYSITV